MKHKKRKLKKVTIGTRAGIGDKKIVPSGPISFPRPCVNRSMISRSLLPLRLIFRVHPNLGPYPVLRKSKSGNVEIIFNWDVERKVIANALYN